MGQHAALEAFWKQQQRCWDEPDDWEARRRQATRAASAVQRLGKRWVRAVGGSPGAKTYPVNGLRPDAPRWVVSGRRLSAAAAAGRGRAAGARCWRAVGGRGGVFGVCAGERGVRGCGRRSRWRSSGRWLGLFLTRRGEGSECARGRFDVSDSQCAASWRHRAAHPRATAAGRTRARAEGTAAAAEAARAATTATAASISTLRPAMLLSL